MPTHIYKPPKINEQYDEEPLAIQESHVHEMF